MSKLLMIRHGQASFGAQNYDQLSDIGTKQGHWLGQHLGAMNIQPARIITGGLQRHKQTAAAICEGLEKKYEIEEHSGWNEFDFYAVANACLELHPELKPAGHNVKAFFTLLKAAMEKWSENKLPANLPETWAHFETRVQEAMAFSKKADKNGPVLVVSSGGAISMALKQLLKVENKTMIDLNLQTRNTSISEVYFNENHQYLCSFNAIPHLETPERRDFITYA